jgi:peptidoglycan/xylan/chitin deacetylase (PgdA/CDA1 family)
MDDSFSELRNRLAEGGRRIWSGRSLQPQHRRRRGLAIALVVVGVVALLIGISSGSGSSGGPHRMAARTTGAPRAGRLSAEDAAINRTLAYTPYVRVAGAQHRELALTFDDGPGPYTPRILSILEREHVTATFFEVGVLERYFGTSTDTIVDKHFAVGDHTQGHLPMSRLPAAGQQTQILEQTSAIGAHGAPFPRLFRPPFGLWNSTTLKILAQYKMLMVMWTVDTHDWRRPGASAIVRSVLTGARPGAIILLHDAGGNRSETIKALPTIIKELRNRGYRFVTVPRLLLDNPPPLNQKLPPGIAGQGG